MRSDQDGGGAPGIVGQQRLVVVLQETSHLSEDVEPPVVQDLGQVGHAADVDLLGCVEKQRPTSEWTDVCFCFEESCRFLRLRWTSERSFKLLLV